MGACPRVAEILPRPLRHEVFPGCSPAQVMADEFACTGACPMPCRVTIPDAKTAFAIGYDNGRFARSVVTSELGTEPFETCDYEGATLVACTSDRSQRAPVERDPHGRIVVIGEDEHRQFGLEYDARGDAVSVEWRDQEVTAALTYDRDHQLIGERYRAGSLNDLAIDYAYDTRGNVVSITSTNHALPRHPTAIHFGYDVANRRVRVTRDADDHGVSKTIAFDYDARGRLVRAIETARDATQEESHDTSYAYDCTAP